MHDKFTRVIANLLKEQVKFNASIENSARDKAQSELRKLCHHYRTAISCLHIYSAGGSAAAEDRVRKQAIELLQQLLKERENLKSWRHEERYELKQTLLNTLDKTSDEHDRVTFIRCIGILIGQEQHKDDPWLNVLCKYIEAKSQMPNEQQRLAVSELFQTLTATTPKCFQRHLSMYFALVQMTLINADADNRLNTPTVANMMEGLAQLTPFGFKGHNLDVGISNLTPLIIRALGAFIAAGEFEAYTRASKLMDSVMVEPPTQLLSCNLKLYMNFLVECARNNQIHVGLRAHALQHIANFWNTLKKTIVQESDFQQVLNIVLNAFTTECLEQPVVENYSFRLQFVGTPMFDAAVSVYQKLLGGCAIDRVFSKLWRQLKHEFLNGKPLRQRAVYICLVLLAEEFSEPLCRKNFNKLLSLLQLGVANSTPLVRDFAFMTVAVFTERSQPTVWQFTTQLLPWLCQYLAELEQVLKAGGEEPKCTHRIFYALELHCKHGERSVVHAHIPDLFQQLFKLHKLNCSIVLRMLTLSAFAALCNHMSDTQLEPHFNELMPVLKTHLVEATNKSEASLRCQAMDTISAVATAVKSDRFLPQAEPILNYAVAILPEASDDLDTRRAIFRLIGVLSGIANKQMPRVYRLIMNKVFASANGNRVKQKTERRCGGSVMRLPMFDKTDAYSEQEESIYALMRFALNTSDAFLPHLKKAFHCVYNSLDHVENDIRRAACEALKSFVHLQRQYQGECAISLKEMRHMLMPKMMRIVREVEHTQLVSSALRCIKQLLQELGADAMPDIDTTDAVYMCITDVLSLKAVCLCSEHDIQRTHELIVVASQLLPLFGKAMPPDRFAEYFERIPKILYRTLKGSKIMQTPGAQRALIYETLAYCLAPLGVHCSNFIDVIGSPMLRGLGDKNPRVRESACFGLGELMLYTVDRTDTSIANTIKVLTELIATEKDGGVQDRYCGAMARLIIADYTQVPLTHVLSDVFRVLPLRIHQSENNVLVRCFYLLYSVARHALQKFIDKLLAYLKHVLQNQLLDEANLTVTIHLLDVLRTKFPKMFDASGQTKSVIKA